MGLGRVKPTIDIINASPGASIQDGGRYGFLAYGVSPSGPCDALLHAIANCLVGNDRGAAAIEFTLHGGRYRISAQSCRIAVSGRFPVRIDGGPAVPFRSYTLRMGQEIAIGYGADDVRGYIAVAGGFAFEPVLGSLSMHTRAGIGPIAAPNLRGGDRLPLCCEAAPAERDVAFLVESLPPATTQLRAVAGPQDDFFDDTAHTTFAEGIFQVTTRCDRMGCQLQGPEIDYDRARPLISEGVALGSIQVPNEDGLFIVPFPDRQTVGGYAKIATIVSADIRVLAQAQAGTTLRFRMVGVEEAQASTRERSAFLGALLEHVRVLGPREPGNDELLINNLISGVHLAE